MMIHALNRDECFRVLARARLARLACTHQNQPYVVPVYLAYHSTGTQACLYGFTTHGRKVEWMRANPLVCVEVDEVTNDTEWVSVVVNGRYVELPECAGGDSRRLPARADSSHNSPSTRDTTVCEKERLLAYEVLKSHAVWWEPATAARDWRDPIKPLAAVFYKVQIEHVTGRQATRD